MIFPSCNVFISFSFSRHILLRVIKRYNMLANMVKFRKIVLGKSCDLGIKLKLMLNQAPVGFLTRKDE